MSKDDKHSDALPDMTAMLAHNVEQARGAMTNYFQFLQKSMSASPWAGADQTKTLRSYAERNVAAAFEYADKLIHAKDFQELMRIQTEFVQKQMQALGEQTKELGETAAKSAADAFKGPLKP
jgi:phasin